MTDELLFDIEAGKVSLSEDILPLSLLLANECPLRELSAYGRWPSGRKGLRIPGPFLDVGMNAEDELPVLLELELPNAGMFPRDSR